MRTTTQDEPDIWTDPDGIWLEYKNQTYGPFNTGAEAREEYKRLTTKGD